MILHGLKNFLSQFAVDYTQSNDYRQKGNVSLHRLTDSSTARAMEFIRLLAQAQLYENNEPGIDVTDEAILSGLNDYQKVILSVGSIIEEYDTDKIFPVMGFGAKIVTG
jgi:hypothetical protein